MTEAEMRQKLILVAAALRHFEQSADQIGAMMQTTYWQGRKEAIADIRDHIGSLEEFETPATGWSGSPDPSDPDNFWIDDKTGERINAHTGERTK